jgi:hypothetical protein
VERAGRWLARAGLLTLILLASSYYLRLPGEVFSYHHEDDAQYYARIAWHASQGEFFTFDGLNKTNGFHPLWAAVATALWCCTDDPAAYMRLYFVLSYALFIASAFLLFEILRRTTRQTAIAACAAAFFGVEWHFYRTVLSGLETPLFLFLLLLVLYLLIRVPLSMQVRPAVAVTFGALLALLMLSRLDGGPFFATAFALVALRRWLPGHGRSVALAALAAAGPFVAYLGWSRAETGAFLPVSGLMKRIAASAREPGGPGPWLGWIDHASLYCFSTNLPLARWTPPQVDAWLGAAAEPYGHRRPAVVVAAATVTGLVYAAYLWTGRRRGGADEGRAYLTAMCLAAFLLLVFNKLIYHGGVVIYYYTAPLAVAQIAMLAVLLARLADGGPIRRWGSPALAAWLLVLILPTCIRTHIERAGQMTANPRYRYWHDCAIWLRDHAPADRLSAGFNAGIIAHYSGRRHVNLDGKVNSLRYYHEVLLPIHRDPAQRERILFDYLREQGVRHFADRFRPGREDEYWLPERVAALGVRLEKVFEGRPSDGYVGRVYELHFEAAGAEAGGDRPAAPGE